MDLQLVVQRIQKMCEASDLHISEMLSRAGLKKNVVDNMKAGSFPGIDKIEKIAMFFRVKIDTLLYKQADDELLFERLKTCPNMLCDYNPGPRLISERLEEYTLEKGFVRVDGELIQYKFYDERLNKSYPMTPEECSLICDFRSIDEFGKNNVLSILKSEKLRSAQKIQVAASGTDMGAHIEEYSDEEQNRTLNAEDITNL